MNGREPEAVCSDLDKLLFVVGKAAAGSPESECGTENDGISDTLCRFLCFFDAVCYFRGNYRLAYRLAKLLEQLSVLGSFNAFSTRSEKLGVTFTQNAFLFELHCEIESGLTADAGKDGVGTLIAKNLCNVFERKRLHIYLVRNGGVGHDGSGVRVYENDLVALLLECKTSLCACIVKFRRLSYDHRA